MGRTRRVTLREAAEALGISKDAVRKRINRGTLGSDMGEDGRRYVYLPAGGDAGGDEAAQDLGDPDHRDALIEELRAEVAAWREESRRKDHIIAGLVERLPPAIEPPESQNQTEKAEGRSDRGDVPPASSEAQRATEPRSWWRRLLGG